MRERKAHRSPIELQDQLSTEDDLTKLAYWMATGSDKTLILYLNYYRFLHYNNGPLVGYSILCHFRKEQNF